MPHAGSMLRANSPGFSGSETAATLLAPLPIGRAADRMGRYIEGAPGRKRPRDERGDPPMQRGPRRSVEFSKHHHKHALTERPRVARSIERPRGQEAVWSPTQVKSPSSPRRPSRRFPPQRLRRASTANDCLHGAPTLLSLVVRRPATMTSR